MRDDIHTRVAVPVRWQRLVKRALTPADRGAEADHCFARNVLSDFEREIGSRTLVKLQNDVAEHAQGLLRSSPPDVSPTSLGAEPTPLLGRLLERIWSSSEVERKEHDFVIHQAKAVMEAHAQSHFREAIATVAAARGANVSETIQELVRLQSNSSNAIDDLLDRRISGQAIKEIAPSRRVNLEEDLRG